MDRPDRNHLLNATQFVNTRDLMLAKIAWDANAIIRLLKILEEVIDGGSSDARFYFVQSTALLE